MTTLLVFDATTVGLAANPQVAPDFDAWFRATTGQAELIVPAVADYEVRRELIRADKPLSVARLDRFVRTFRYEGMTVERWHIAPGSGLTLATADDRRPIQRRLTWTY